MMRVMQGAPNVKERSMAVFLVVGDGHQAAGLLPLRCNQQPDLVLQRSCTKKLRLVGLSLYMWFCLAAKRRWTTCWHAKLGTKVTLHMLLVYGHGCSLLSRKLVIVQNVGSTHGNGRTSGRTTSCRQFSPPRAGLFAAASRPSWPSILVLWVSL